ncbi:VanW family protein [Paenibacillus sp. 1001270B_150601_E10]|uniref:VanW family protein n=1 Tax=Paenibacillus sp. 1001270B_150601_E10 TaxID=2787079 RepID=UPI001E4371B0|nr:VanW family protein [Paenibacillus sp. 1001270B_150601_E10]
MSDKDSNKQVSSPDDEVPHSSSIYRRMISAIKERCVRHRRAMITAVALVGLIGAGFQGYAAWSLRDDRLPEGYQVMGIQAGGLTPAEVKQRFNEQLGKWKEIAVMFEPDRTEAALNKLLNRQFSLEELGVEFNEEAAFKQLEEWEEGGFWTRLALKRELADVQLEAEAVLNDQKLLNTMQHAYGSLIDRKPQDAIANYSNPLKPTFQVEEPGIELDEHSLKQLLLKKVTAELKKGDQPDHLIMLRMPLITLPASTTVQMLEERKPDALLSRTIYDVSHLEERELKAVSASAKLLDGKVLVPGEAMQERSFAVAVEDQLDLRDSEGVYQAAAVMYQAALQAGLAVAEQSPSSMSVSQVASSADMESAVIRPELIVRNNTKGDVIWQSEVHEGKLIVDLYGKKEPGVSYEIETIHSPENVQDKEGMNLKRLSMVKSQELEEAEVSASSPPKEIYRIKRIDGKVVQRERIAVSMTRHMRSTYSY